MPIHSWSGPSEQCHQTLLWVPNGTSDGLSAPFLVGCHCAATSGKRMSSRLVLESLNPRQQAHPSPRKVRLCGGVSHSWSSATGHFHQTFLFDPATTSPGVRSSFLVGCHSAANSGNRSANDSPGLGTADATPPVFPNATTTADAYRLLVRQVSAARDADLRQRSSADTRQLA